MLAVTPQLPVAPCQDVFAAAISAQLQHVFDGNISAFARYFQVDRSTARDWMQGKQVPQLLSFLEVCDYLGTTPTHFFHKNPLETTLIPGQARVEQPPKRKQSKQYRNFPTEQLQAALETILRDDEDPPPSMREVARRLGYDQSHLYKHLPELCRQISERWSAYWKAQREARVKKLCEAVDQAVEMVHLQGNYPSSSRLRKLLRKSGYMRDKEVQVTWKNRMKELGWK
ncbi:MAG TPA: hypothetical protein VFV38_13690 [Ktedonobacteraceae bacterium]|nr:hypothetical protein [Ktedonobacteraceae bacterium]